MKSNYVCIGILRKERDCNSNYLCTAVRTFSSTAAADATEVMDCGSWLDPRDSSVAVSSAADADNDGGVEFSLFPSGESCGTTWIQ